MHVGIKNLVRIDCIRTSAGEGIDGIEIFGYQPTTNGVR